MCESDMTSVRQMWSTFQPGERQIATKCPTPQLIAFFVGWKVEDPFVCPKMELNFDLTPDFNIADGCWMFTKYIISKYGFLFAIFKAQQLNNLTGLLDACLLDVC